MKHCVMSVVFWNILVINTKVDGVKIFKVLTQKIPLNRYMLPRPINIHKLYCRMGSLTVLSAMLK